MTTIYRGKGFPLFFNHYQVSYSASSSALSFPSCPQVPSPLLLNGLYSLVTLQLGNTTLATVFQSSDEAQMTYQLVDIEVQQKPRRSKIRHKRRCMLIGSHYRPHTTGYKQALLVKQKTQSSPATPCYHNTVSLTTINNNRKKYYYRTKLIKIEQDC